MNGRIAFVGRRVLITLPVLLTLSVFVFLLIRLVPGDPVRTMLGFRATPENVAAIREDLGLDRPLLAQYGSWLGGLFRGDFGEDYVSGASLSSLLATSLPVTLELTFLAMGLATVVGVPLGVMAASRGKGWRGTTEGFVIAGISIPDFWLGIMLVLLFAGTLSWLPPSGYVRITESPLDNLRYMVLPVLALAIGEAAYIARTTRSAIEDALAKPYAQYLRAKGVTERNLVFRHALRNAGVPIATVIGIQFGVLLGGSIVIEYAFGLPGLGRLTVVAINQRNYTVVQGGVLVLAVMFIVVNLVVDLLVGAIDPRVADGAAT
jgi:peptide/nickel transport system permease protein